MADRAQSEVVGVVILIGVVVTMVGIVSVVIFADTGADGSVLADVTVEANATHLRVVHMGGENIAVSDFGVVLDGTGDEVRVPVDSANVSGGDGRFDPGDRFVRTHGLEGDRARIVVVHSDENAVVAETTVTLDG
ncbi:type IV pilin [Halorientalis pallida]|uniref:Type IV pilin n=1 Tax=Halorientalis pallida TaxID=2479928 RepID=A0A498L0K0_9EURY|nr:type IV pilin [Halorientalis pallida]RXK51577.1 type IV pilin [Halorientalis pallida]